MSRVSDITNFNDLKAHLSNQFHQPKDELTVQAELGKSLSVVDRSVADIKSGRTEPLKKAILEIAQELRLKLNR